MRWPARRRRGTRKEAPGPTPEPPPTPAGTAVTQQYRTENAAAQAYPIYRVLVAAFLCSMGVNMILASCLLWLMPQSRVVPYFLQVEGAGRAVYNVEPLEGSSYARSDAVVEGLVQSYVIQRHQVIEVPTLMRERWTNRRAFLGAHSANTIWDTFQKEAAPLLKSMETQPYRRIIDVEDIRRVDRKRWIYEVRFLTRDSLGQLAASDERVNRWIATVAVRQANYGGQGPSVAVARINPYGLVVTEYSLRQVDKE